MLARTLNLLGLVATTMLLASTALAQPIKLGWSDLLPKLPPLVDPLDKLSFEQRFEVESVLWVRQLTDEEKAERADIVEEANGYERTLKAAGISIDELIATYAKFAKEADARGKMVRDDLNGKDAKIEGYLLPLDFTPEGSTEFLLVPYVGACIHVPPPPANQIVLVTLKERLKVEELFAPVRVSGRLKTKISSAKLFLVDGEADISLGYHFKDASLKILE